MIYSLFSIIILIILNYPDAKTNVYARYVCEYVIILLIVLESETISNECARYKSRRGEGYVIPDEGI